MGADRSVQTERARAESRAMDNEQNQTPHTRLPEVLEGETENQAAAAMERISSQVRRERGAARMRHTVIGVAAVVIAVWLGWQSFAD